MHSLILPKHTNQNYYTIRLCRMRRKLPLCQVKKDLWLMGNEELTFGSDVHFTQAAGKCLASKLKGFKIDSLLTSEAKSLGITYEVARNLGIKDFSVARKAKNPCMHSCISVDISSITCGHKQKLFLDEINRRRIQGKSIAIVDDCISTCSTLKGLLQLASSCDAKVKAIACIWIEGPWPFELFFRQMLEGSFIYLDILPLFASGRTLTELKKKCAAATIPCKTS